MFKKIILLVRIILPFIVNTFLYFVIMESNRDSEYALIDTLFYLGIINIIIGLAALFVIRRTTGIVTSGNQSVFNLAAADQKIKDYHRGERKSLPTYSLIDKYLKLIYIILGVLFCIAAMIVYLK